MSDKPTRPGAMDVEAGWRRLQQLGGSDRRGPDVKDRLAAEKRAAKKIDRRTLRRTGRTEQFNVRLKQETKDAILRLAEANNWLNGEVVERAIALLEQHLAERDRTEERNAPERCDL